MARGEDDSKANELAKTFDLAGIEDAELLALALPYRDELSVSERLKFVDRIIEHSDDWEERVRFLCYRASLWGLLGDRKGAARGFMQAIKAVPADPEPDWGHSLVVGAYVQAGRSNARRDLVERALELCTRFLEGAADEPLLEFELRKARSAVMKGLSRDLDCIVDLRWVAEERGTDDDRIQLAQGLIAVGEFEEARTILQRVPFEDLTPGEQYDHTFALFGLLYGIQDEQLIALVRQRLADLDPEFPAWREIRDRFLLSLSRSGEKVEYPAWWASVRETVVLQPSVFGIGVDVGKLLDRALRRRGKGVDVHRQLHAKGDEGS